MNEQTRRNILKYVSTGTMVGIAGCGDSEPGLPTSTVTGTATTEDKPYGGTSSSIDPSGADWDVLVQIPDDSDRDVTYISVFEENPGPTYNFIAEGADLGGEKVAGFGNIDSGRYIYAVTAESTEGSLPEDTLGSGNFCIPPRYDRPLLYTYDGEDLGCNLMDDPFERLEP